MNFDKLVSGYKTRTCIISVENYNNGEYGNIQVVAANQMLQDDAEQVFHHPYQPNCPYYFLLPRDKNFEDFMYRCACLGKPLHTYVHLEKMGLWVNMFLLPLESDKENVGYCLYSCDISPYADTEQQASLAADTASTALDISIKLRGTDTGNIRQAFNEVIEEIQHMSGAEHCAILLPESDKGQYSVFCEATASGSVNCYENIYSDKNFGESVENFDIVVGESSCVIIQNENIMKQLETVKESFRSLLSAHDIKSVIIYPLRHNGQTLGYLWVLNYNINDTVKIKETLEYTTFLIASEISNYQLMKRLEILSSTDMLTGCMNRNAMNNRVDEIVNYKIKPKEPCAVIFTDLNGLKRINDEQGHISGDKLIRTASAVLRHVFYDCAVYRAGGDEFMLITEGLSETDLKERLAELKEKSTVDEDIQFAVGYCFWNADEDILNVMRIADEKMYADKKQYYKNHPEKKYR